MERPHLATGSSPPGRRTSGSSRRAMAAFDSSSSCCQPKSSSMSSSMSSTARLPIGTGADRAVPCGYRRAGGVGILTLGETTLWRREDERGTRREERERRARKVERAASSEQMGCGRASRTFAVRCATVASTAPAVPSSIRKQLGFWGRRREEVRFHVILLGCLVP